MQEPHIEFAQYLNAHPSDTADRLDAASEEVLNLATQLEGYVDGLKSAYAESLRKIAALERENQAMKIRYRLLLAIANTLTKTQKS